MVSRPAPGSSRARRELDRPNMLNWTVDQSGMTDGRFQRQCRMPRALFYGMLWRIEPDLFCGEEQYRLANM